MDDAEARGGAELGPVGGGAKPLEVGAQELVARGARVHERVGHDGRGVRHAHASVERVLHVLEQQQVRRLVEVEVVERDADGPRAAEDGHHLVVLLRELRALRRGGGAVGGVRSGRGTADLGQLGLHTLHERLHPQRHLTVLPRAWRVRRASGYKGGRT